MKKLLIGLVLILMSMATVHADVLDLNITEIDSHGGTLTSSQKMLVQDPVTATSTTVATISEIMALAANPVSAGGDALGTTALEWSDLYLYDGAIIYGQADQSATLTSSASTWTASAFATTNALTVGTSLIPDAADGAVIGSTSAEWSDLYLFDSAVIYGQADQSNTLTSSATGWEANLLFTGNAGLSTKNGATSAGFINFLEDSDNAAHKIVLKGQDSLAADIDVTLPSAAGTILTTTDVDDVAVNGVDTAPISSNWAFDHESVFGTAIGTGLLLDTATLKASAILQEYHAVDPASHGLGIVQLTDPAADGLLMWDDDPGTHEYGAIGTALAYNGTTLSVSTAAVSNGDTTHVPTCDGVYDWATGIFSLVADIDNAPVEDETGAPISSGYMYTHVNAADPHSGYLPDYQIFTAFTGSDATPDVSGGQYFQTADTTTITDFDGATVDGQLVVVLCLHAGTFDFTASGLTSPYGENHLMIVGSVEVFYYDLENSTWVWATPKAPTATISTNGVICRTGSGTASARTLATTSAGLDWTNGDGAAGAPNVDLDIAPSAGSATLEQSDDALQVKYQSTHFTEGASGLELNADGITVSLMANGDWGDFTIATNTASLDAGVVDAAASATVMKTDGATISIGNWADAVSTGAYYSKAFRVPFKATLAKVIVTSDGNVGSCTIDVWSDAASATTGMDNITDADSLFDTASEPAIADASSDNYVEVSSFDSGEDAIAAGDWIVVNVDANTTLTGLNISFELTRTD